MEEKQAIESDVEKQKQNYEQQLATYESQYESQLNSYESQFENQVDSYESQLDSYESQLQYYDEKARELEERINELNATKEEIYNMLSSNSDKPISSFAPDSAMGGPHIEDTDATLDSIYAVLEERLDAESTEYASLAKEAEGVRQFLNAKPSIWPVYGTITSTVGSRANPFGGSGSESHSGLDIAVPTGTYVRATGNGTVKFSGWQSGYGNLVIISHGYGYETYYGHNSKLLLHVGDKVSRGDYIALSGSTGRSTGPHVHYEIRLNGAIKNPLNYLK
jgi:murein DD-endopeptidase MepM/ murein hydrolase activator NlpD